MIYNVAIDITNHCNFECIHCLRDKLSTRHHMSPELLNFILDGIVSVGIKDICLTGGETSLHPELNRIFEVITDHGVRFSLVSNGSLFIENIMPLFDSKTKKHLSGVCFSLDGATESSHDSIRKSGSFKKVVESIDACVKEGIPVSVKSIIHKRNRQEIADVAFLCASKGVGDLGYVLLTPTPRLMKEKMMPSSEEYLETIRYIKNRIIPSFAMTVNIEGYAESDYKVPFCNPAHGISIDHLGNLIFCCNLSHPTNGDSPNVFGKEFLGNIKEIGIEEGILRHYRRLEWFMGKIMHMYQHNEEPVNCTKCFRLFEKLKWMEVDESADHRHP